METALAPLAQFTTWLLKTSAQASVLIGLVLLVQWLFRKKLPPRWRYALWLLVLIRLLLPAAPESPSSIFNLFPPVSAKTSMPQIESAKAPPLPAAAPATELLLVSNAPLLPPHHAATVSGPGAPVETNALSPNHGITSPADVVAETAPSGAVPAAKARSAWPLILSFAWLAGALSFAAATFWFPMRLNRQPAGQHRVVNPAVREVLADCQRVMNVRRVLPVVQSRAVHGPALMGFIRPWLLLPEGILEKFTPEELRFVFLHELAHLKRRDIAVNWLMTFLLILHWFNPLVWFAFARMRADRELACDALALSFANDQESQPYGQTILKLLEGFTRPPAIAGLVGILEDKQQMKRRITMIAQFKKSPGWPVLAVALVALLGCVSLTDSKRNETDAANNSGAGGAAASVDRRADTQPSPASNGQLTIRRVTPQRSERWDHWVTFGDTRPSPDGRYFGYVNWTHGNLAICDMQTGELRDLTSQGTWVGRSQFTWGAVWSPDSRQIAFIWVQGDEGDLRIIDRQGGEPRVLVPREKGGSIAPFDWSQDGKFIVGLAPIRKWPNGSQKNLRIVRVDVATGDVTVVKELPNASDNISMSLSPDGKYLAHDTKARGKDAATSPPSRIHVVSTDGSEDRLLIDHPAAHSSPHWSPDGGHLIFRSKRSGEDALWTVPMRGIAAAGEPRILRAGFGGSALLGFSRDGTLYFTASTPRMNVFVADADFEAGTMGTPRLVSLRHDGKNRNARWSMDGTQLAYISARSPDWPPAGALVFQDIATGKERDVEVSGLNFFSRPYWSPDLGKLAGPAKVPGRGNNSRALYLVEGKTGQRSMYLDKDAACANYTRDGRHLIYMHHNWKGRDTTRDLIERDISSGAERVIPSTKENLGFNDEVFLSPDGNRLAHCHQPYSSSEDHKTSLYVTTRADGAMRKVWEFRSGEATVCDWLPDNRQVLVSVTDKDGTQQLQIIDTEAERARPFGPALRGENRLSQISVHPDGKRIAVSRGGLLSEIWAIKNFAPQDKLATK